MPHRNREPDPGNTRPAPPPTRPLPFGESDTARPDDRAAAAQRSGHRVRPVTDAAARSPERIGRFARVFGALGGSRGAADGEPSTREVTAPGPGRLDARVEQVGDPRPNPSARRIGDANGIPRAPDSGRPGSGAGRPTPGGFGPAPGRGLRPEAGGDGRHRPDLPSPPGAQREPRADRTAGHPTPRPEPRAPESRAPGPSGAGPSGAGPQDRTERAGTDDRPGGGESGEPAATKEYPSTEPGTEYDDESRRSPRKLTVTRVAAMRGRELTEKGIATFRRAAEADGADKSGLTALTYATMANFALDAAIAVALANTLFFASATAESKSKVALYLLITIAPFAIIAPLIGPALDRLQRGRRLALASSFAVRAVLAVVLIFSFDSWVLYPLALCMMVLSKSFAVLKSAVTPRVLPPDIDLVRTNSRLTVFGLVGGTLGAGGIAGVTAAITGSTGVLILATGIAVGGAYLSWRMPRWVEITEGEVPTTLGYHRHDAPTELLETADESAVPPRKRRQPLGRAVVTGLWGNGSIRVLTGFLTFYIAFVAKATEHRPVQQAAMLGLVGAAAAVGNFAGNASGARIQLGRPSLIVVNCTIGCTAVAVLALVLDNLFGAALAALVASGASALAKVSLDAAIQDDLPPESIASGFGRSETVLQLSWVIGGAGGVLLPTDYWKGFAVVSALLAGGSSRLC